MSYETCVSCGWCWSSCGTNFEKS
ncbi:4Fe-4S binding protein [Aerococcus sp. UMB7834]